MAVSFGALPGTNLIGAGSRYSAVAVAIVLLGACLTGCRREPIPAQQILAGRTMGTSYSVTIVPWPDMPDLAEISNRVDRELVRVNEQMSTYIESSELSQFNAQQSTDWFPVSIETAEVVLLALEIHQLTDGVFDVTVGPLVDLWGFGPPGQSEHLPTNEQVAETLHVVGSEKLAARLDPPALKKSVPGLRVDLSAIAKGHGVDRVAAVLDQLQCKNYFVEVGGEVRVRGNRMGGGPWRVGIEKPTEGNREIQQAIELLNLSLATSGDYRNFYEAEGQRITHFIDPKSGLPIASEIGSVSVLDENCATADGIATGLMSAGLERALALAERHQWAVMLVVHRDGQLDTITTPQFLDLTKSPAHEDSQ
ncbi:MAG: FAD:protein FMN transferase [Pirellulaceae bacterium]